MTLPVLLIADQIPAFCQPAIRFERLSIYLGRIPYPLA
jgi:hypothetical protein